MNPQVLMTAGEPMSYLYSYPGSILLPLALDQSRKEEKAIEFAFWLANTLDRPIHAINVISSMQFLPETMGMQIAAPAFTWEIEDAENKMQETLVAYSTRQNNHKTKVTTRVHIGDTAKWIIAESSASAVTVLSSHPPKYGFFKKFTLINRILADCQGPIAVVPHDSHFEFPTAPRLMLADDLEAHSIDAVNFAAWFASRFSHAELTHLHVTGVTPDVLKTGMSLALSGSYSLNEAKPDFEVIHAKMLEDLQKKMIHRFEDWSGEMERAKIIYNKILAQGHASEQIEKLRTKVNAQIEIYGQHRSSHYTGFGRVLFDSMLSAKVPVVIVPNI